MTHMIHIAATSQLRHDTEGRAYYRRKLAAGKTKAEAMRCLRRRIADTLYRRLRADAERALPDNVETGPGGHHGVVPVRIDATLLAALTERVERDHVSRSEAIRSYIA